MWRMITCGVKTLSKLINVVYWMTLVPANAKHKPTGLWGAFIDN